MILPAQTTPAPSTWSWEWWLDIAGAVGVKAIWVAVILVAAFLLTRVLRFGIHRVVRRIVEGAKSKANTDDTRAIEASPLAQVRIIQRTRTLGTILQNIVNVTVFVVAVLLVVNVIDPTVMGSFALLSAAVGAGLGFGAQNIVKDVLNGIFIVVEDQVGIGDVVDTGMATGVVEYVSVRVTHVRDLTGTLWYVRNGEITRIGNMSQGWSRVVIDLAVPTDSDLDLVENAMISAAKELAIDPKWTSRIIEQPEIWGLESVTGDALVVRLVMKTRASAKDDVARELRLRLKRGLDAVGVTLPASTTYVLKAPEAVWRPRLSEELPGEDPDREVPEP